MSHDYGRGVLRREERSSEVKTRLADCVWLVGGYEIRDIFAQKKCVPSWSAFFVSYEKSTYFLLR